MLLDTLNMPAFATSNPAQLAALSSVRKLFEDFAARNIRYCHWKSNLRLEKGLLGDTDLDLLVDTKDVESLRITLAERHIKRVLAPPGKRYPGIEDYLGLDHETGKLFHLHVHFLLVLGEQYVKNYHLPLEEQFLKSVVSVDGWVNVPAPELELSVLCMRALLKYRDRDAIKDILKIRSTGLSTQMLTELDWLTNQISLDSMTEVLSKNADVLPALPILEFLELIQNTPRDGFKLWRLRAQVRRSLKRYQRRGRLWAIFDYFGEMWRRQLMARINRKGGMTLPHGGLTLTLLGPDGAGKSTLTNELAKWLSWRMEVHQHYLGSKQPSLASSLFYLLFRVFRRLHTSATGKLGKTNFFTRALSFFRKMSIYQHYLSIGRDRYRRYKRGEQQARQGAIVLFDRFPYESPLDGPEIENLSNTMPSRFVGFFVRREKRLYARFGPPDQLVILDVTPEVSAKRKPDHSLETIQAKKRAIEKLETNLKASSTTNWTKLNVDRPLEEVLLQLKRKIWGVL